MLSVLLKQQFFLVIGMLNSCHQLRGKNLHITIPILEQSLLIEILKQIKYIMDKKIVFVMNRVTIFWKVARQRITKMLL